MRAVSREMNKFMILVDSWRFFHFMFYHFIYSLLLAVSTAFYQVYIG